MKTTTGWVSAIFLGGLVLAALAQWLLSYHRELAWAGGVSYAVALVLLAGGVALGYRRLSRRSAQRLFLAASAVGLVAWATHMAYIQHRYECAMLLWGVGIALAVAALLRLKAWRPCAGWQREAVAMSGLFGVALALRLVGLGRFPDPMLGDEGSMALAAGQIFHGELVNPFGTGWLAHPNLFFYLEAAALRLFGWNLFGLRFAAALLGALGVPAVYVLAKGVWGRPVAWVSAFFLAGWGLSLQLSRLALNNSADPLFGALVMTGLHRGLMHGRRWGFVVAGLALGTSMYFYHGTRLLMPLALLVLALAGAWRLKKRWRGVLVFVFIALLVAGPLLVNFILSPDGFLVRQGSTSILGDFYRKDVEQEQALTGNPVWLVMVNRLGRVIFPFILTRDRGFFYTPDMPMLYILSGALFVLGVGLALQHWQEPRYAALLGWLGLTILLGGFLFAMPPQYQRYLVAAPAICMLVGRAAIVLLRLAARLWNWRPIIQRGAVLAVAVVLLVGNAAYYFGVYAPSGVFSGRYTEIADRTARLMADLGPSYMTYFFGATYMKLSSFNSVYFLAPDANWVDVAESPPVDWNFVQEERGALFVLLPERAGEVPLLREQFPGGEERQVIGRDGGVLLTIYRVDSVTVQPTTGEELQ